MRTERLAPDKAGIARAAALLSAGETVAFPTETVYGLGADARNDTAVAKIFEAKGRPSFNPLIVHLPTVQDAGRIGDIPRAAHQFLNHGWPEGLTLVVPLLPEAGISLLTTAGQRTVALRVPASPLARDLLTSFGGPVAAPSANPSGRVSPTSADHVLNGLNGRIAAVLDGGETAGGLESTILGFDGDQAIVFREGLYQVPDTLPRKTAMEDGAAANSAPGMMSSHYAPQGKLRINAIEPAPGEWYIGFGACETCDANLSPTGNLREAAANLFAMLHEADTRPRIAMAPIPDTGLGRAINDRLRRAAAPR